jgi:hypothetical protein
MTKCKRMKELMQDALDTNNPLTETDRQDLQAHLKSCARCSEEYNRLTGLMSILDKRVRPQMSEVFWDNFYSRIEDRLEEETMGPVTGPKKASVEIKSSWQKEWGFGFKIRWVFYPAAAAVIIVVGIAIGQFLSLPEGKDFVRQLNPAVAAHFDNVQPLLVDYANYTPEEETDTPEETVMVEKSTVEKLLLENQLLKRLVAKEDNITANELMDELELILLELKNSGRNNKETLRAVQKLIKDNDILFKIKVLKKKEERALTI